MASVISQPLQRQAMWFPSKTPWWKTNKALYECDPRKGNPPLQAAEHKWEFAFRFNRDASIRPTFMLLNAPGSQSCLARVRYGLRAVVMGSDMHSEIFEAERYLSYWPLRNTDLPDGPLPVAHMKRVRIAYPNKPILGSEASYRRRPSWLFGAPQIPQEEVRLGVHLPRFVILATHYLDVSPWSVFERRKPLTPSSCSRIYNTSSTFASTCGAVQM